MRLLVGAPPGGTADVFVRLVCQWLSNRLGQPFVIENRLGAATNIAAEAVVRAPPDGYTLYDASTANAINATLYDNLNFNFIRDIAPVAGVVRVFNVMDVNPSFPAKTVPEFIAYAKANPGKINMGSAGIGSTIHLSGELFKAMTGVDMVHVPYRGGPDAVTALLSGDIQVMFDNLTNSIQHIKAGKLRPLAVTASARLAALPDVPTISEFVPGYEASAWWGVGAPKNTPADIIDKLNSGINLALADPNIKTRFADLGGTPMPMTVAEFTKLIADETEKWGKLIRADGIKPQ